MPIPSHPSRRGFLRGLGITLALPAFESLLPRSVLGAGAAEHPLAVTSGGAPLRTAFIYVPNGAQQNYWFPTGEGCDFQLSTTMEPLAGLKCHLQVMRGLDHQHAEP
ncbi:MAG: DUF1552 domain-containing protein, partial [Planctomycetaceae bacterium]|nr:DUF1552 domain-containing protein [Planctomycetaceae bacterium]